MAFATRQWIPILTFCASLLVCPTLEAQLVLACVTPPSCQAVVAPGAAVSVEARVEDAAGIPQPGVTVLVTVPGIEAPMSATSDANGIVTVDFFGEVPAEGARIRLRAVRASGVADVEFLFTPWPSTNEFSIACLMPATCETPLPTAGVVQLRGRVQNGAGVAQPGVPVLVTLPGVTTPMTVVSDASGDVLVTFRGSVPPAGARVALRIVRGSSVAEGEFRITSAGQAATYTLSTGAGGDQVWRPGLQLKDSVTVHVMGPTNQTECTGRVAFRPLSGGSVYPDTARATWDGANCRAWTHWILGAHVGKHKLAATLVGTRQRAELMAVARAEGRFSTGMALTVWTWPFHRLSRSADTSEVTRTYTRADTVVSERRKEIASADTVVPATQQWAEVEPIVGVDVPLFHHPTLRVFFGVSATHPTRSWYAGFDLSQLIKGGFEATGFGVYVGGRLSRRKVGTTSGCRPGTTFCETDQWRPEGPTIWISLDAGKALGLLASAFGG